MYFVNEKICSIVDNIMIENSSIRLDALETILSVLLHFLLILTKILDQFLKFHLLTMSDEEPNRPLKLKKIKSGRLEPVNYHNCGRDYVSKKFNSVFLRA